MEDSTTLLGFLVLFTLWCLFYWQPRRKLWAAGRLIPGTRPLPIIGDAQIFWGDPCKTLPELQKLKDKFGNVVRAWLGDKMMVMVSDPDDIKYILRHPNLKNRDFNMAAALKPFFGNGLFSNADEMWTLHRRLVNPMFHYKALASFVEVFGAKAKILVDKLDEVADGKSFDVNKKLCLCTLDAICETIIGSAGNTQEAGYSSFQKVHYEATALVHRRVIYPWQLIPWLYPFTADGRKTKEVRKSIDAFNREVISRKLVDYRQGIRDAGIVTGSGKVVTSLLDILIEAGESVITEQEMQDEVITLTAGGLITTSITMSTLLILIAIHPEWQNALFAEMSDVFADDMTRPATNQDLSKMPVLDRVIKETLRLYPVVPLIPREVTEDIVLPSGYTLPAGCSVVAVNYIVHRDPKNYPQPEKFLPDRWLPGSDINDHPYAYLPFGGGARHCPGQKYAHMQMKTITSQILRRFKMTTDLTMKDLEKVEMSFMLRLRSGGYQLKLEKRNVESGA